MKKINWDLVNPHDFGLITVVANRIYDRCIEFINQRVIVEKDPRRFIEPDKQQIIMDYCVLHIRVGLDLERMVRASIDELMPDFVQLQKSIIRADAAIPLGLRWEFGDSGKCPTVIAVR